MEPDRNIVIIPFFFFFLKYRAVASAPEWVG
jgi:hypothetical protein